MSRKVEHPLLTAIAKAQYDLTSAQAWLAEVRRQVSKLGLVDGTGELYRCSHCGIAKTSRARLAAHLVNVHDVDPKFAASVLGAHELGDVLEREAA